MFENETTLVLGAGASMPFEFPSGYELVEDICKLPFDPGWQQNWVEDFRYRFEEFKKTLKCSGINSIDTFLEHRNEYEDVGKYAIAVILKKCEIKSDVFKFNKNWYRLLFKKMNEGCTFDTFDKNKLSIVTFNYDRSIEYFLINSLSNTYKKGINDCFKTLDSINIIHVYGSLGKIMFTEATNFYEKEENFDAITRASKQIHILGREERQSHFDDIYKVLLESKVIYFLGFGYDKTNMELLKLKDLDKSIEFRGTHLEIIEEHHLELKKTLLMGTGVVRTRTIDRNKWRNNSITEYLKSHRIGS